MTPTWGQWCWALLDPAIMLKSAIYHYLSTLLSSIKHGKLPLTAAQRHAVRDTAFSSFWSEYTKPNPSSNPTPSISASLIPPLLAQASGIVLDLGPGSGTQLPYLNPSSITKIYGAEPCIALHDRLQSAANHCQMADQYKIINASANPESLWRGLVAASALEPDQSPEGMFDTIICVRVLCSVPDPEATARWLYKLLRPGGQILVCEHIANPWPGQGGSALAWLMQKVYMFFGWAFFVGNCCMDRDTGKVLLDAPGVDGGWAEASLEVTAPWSTFPYVSGVLRKGDS